jgi:hypothetical protein
MAPLRSFFEWCAGVGLSVLDAQRPHIELWRAASEERALAASAIHLDDEVLQRIDDLTVNTVPVSSRRPKRCEVGKAELRREMANRGILECMPTGPPDSSELHWRTALLGESGAVCSPTGHFPSLCSAHN